MASTPLGSTLDSQHDIDRIASTQQLAQESAQQTVLEGIKAIRQKTSLKKPEIKAKTSDSSSRAELAKQIKRTMAAQIEKVTRKEENKKKQDAKASKAVKKYQRTIMAEQAGVSDEEGKESESENIDELTSASFPSGELDVFAELLGPKKRDKNFSHTNFRSLGAYLNFISRKSIRHNNDLQGVLA